MSLRLETLQVARLAPRQLRDASDLVAEFLRSQISDDGGGFIGRDGKPDLYYTVFGIDALMALQHDVPKGLLRPFVSSFGDGEGLDLIHVGCLARCYSALEDKLDPTLRSTIADRLESFRSDDGAYHNEPGSERGTVYGCFVALGAYQDLGLPLPSVPTVHEFIRSVQTSDGGYANEHGLKIGATPPTAAAVSLLRNLELAPSPAAGDFLLKRFNPQGGGFFAVPGAPMPDLLSTATCLHALAGLERSAVSVREACLDFIDTLWSSSGSFFGHWADEHLDSEYTYYGLLALGHLSV
ncbi:MAG: prenyltransferase/squalene oxidase repeat-containing protein [Planctomycetota bacterium]